MKTHYLIIGNGRLSRHLQHYFSLLEVPFQVWTRQSTEYLTALIVAADRVCLAIKDDALAPFVAAHPELKNKAIHFSGSLNIEGAYSAHPLMTFGLEVYPPETYSQIPFVTVEGEPSLRDLFPEFLNPAVKIPASMKALYHAYCVMCGNFTTLLWQSLFKDFEERLKIPKTFVEPYLQQITANLLRNSNGALTGPIARGDTETIRRNLEAVAGSPYEKIYQSFLNLAQAKTAPKGSFNEHLRLQP